VARIRIQSSGATTSRGAGGPCRSSSDQLDHRGQGEVGGQPVAAPERQQVAHGDRPTGGHHVVDRRLRGAHHHRRRQLREPALDRVVQAEPTLVDEQHRRRGGDRLAVRRDPEDRVARHRRPVDVAGADDRDLQVGAARHGGHRAGEPACPHVPVEQLGQ
jgi:hypothetical protein